MPTPSDTIFVPSIQRAVRLEPAALADLLRDRIVHPPTGRADDRHRAADGSEGVQYIHYDSPLATTGGFKVD